MFVLSLAYEPNSTVVRSLACEPSFVFVPSYVMVSSSYGDSEDENPPPPSHLPSFESFEPEPTSTPLLPRWVCLTREVVGDLVSDPSDQHQTHS
jgi:hypothetical protein